MRIIEATLIVPLTLLITAALIGLTMKFYGDLNKQIEAHATERKEIYKVSETVAIRLQDRLSYEIYGAEKEKNRNE